MSDDSSNKSQPSHHHGIQEDQLQLCGVLEKTIQDLDFLKLLFVQRACHQV